MKAQNTATKKRVTHFIPGLDLGGAETMLYQLLLNRDREDIQYCVVNLGMGDYYIEKIMKLSIPVVTVQITRKPISSIFRLRRLFKNTTELCCWMYHTNLIGYLLFDRKAKEKKLIWNIRHSNLDPEKNKRLTLVINRICAHFSRNVDTVVYNGKEAKDIHEKVGYSPKISIVLDNGCDLERFCFDGDKRENTRKKLGIRNDNVVVLSVARDAPIKDLPTFVAAFRKIHEIFPNTLALMCGEGVDEDNNKLKQIIEKEQLRVGKDVLLLGRRDDIEQILNACDVYVLHSAGEALPNILIQAMACECLCVSTDVGEAKRILDDESLIVEPQNPEKLSQTVLRILSYSKERREELKSRNRRIVLEKYDIKKVSKKYESVF